MFYFHWVDATDKTWNPAFAVDDEDVFSVNVRQSEGDFATLEVDIRNPRKGLLAPSRKRWAWLSYRKQDTTLVPLFFGRLVGVPQDIQDDILRVTFVARPGDFEEQKSALAASMRVAPYYDPLWDSEQSQRTDDSVLEGYPCLWHIDRITGEVTASDIITGEDGLLNFEEDQPFYDSVSVSFGDPPARRIYVDATVNWTQKGSGSIDITKDILAKFAEQTFTDVRAINGLPRTKGNMINVIPGDDLIKKWPQFGDSIGGGWTVGVSSAAVAGKAPLAPILLDSREAYRAAVSWATSKSRIALQFIFDRAPGFAVEVQDQKKVQDYISQAPIGLGYAGIGQTIAHSDVNILWLPIWQVGVHMELNWEAARDRTEVISFYVDADVQEVMTDPGEEEIIRLSVGQADVDAYIGDLRRDAYYKTGRGLQTVQNLIARARAHLLARARTVEVQFSVPFEDGLDLSCRHSASIKDPRLPDGIAAGKIIGYSLTSDGDTGVMLATLTIGCTVGRGGTIEEVDGDPLYVDLGYVDPGYQDTENGVVVPIPGAIGYTMANYSPTGDGVSFFNVRRDNFLTSLTVTGGLDFQKPAAADAGSREIASGPNEVIDKINAYKTKVALTLRPVTGGPYITNVSLVTTGLKVPRTINLESEGPPKLLAGRINANPAFRGALAGLELSGRIDADPELRGMLRVVQNLAGVIDADPVLSGALPLDNELAGVIDADPVLSGALSIEHELSGVVDADPVLSGAFRITHLLSGAIDADPLFYGALLPPEGISGRIDANPELRGAIQVAHDLAGAIDADPALSGALLQSALLAGAIDVDPVLSGSVQIAHDLVAAIDANPVFVGAILIPHTLAGAIDADPTLAGSVQIAHDLAGAIDANPSMSGTVVVTRLLAGVIDVNPALSGNIEEPGDGFAMEDDSGAITLEDGSDILQE